MIRITFFLFLLVQISFGQEPSEIPRINQSLIKTNDLIWDLNELQKVPEFTYLDSTSN